MRITLKEKEFCDFLTRKYPDNQFELGCSVITINMVHLSPIMSCVYFSDEFIAVAKYNRQMGFFSDCLLLKKEELETIGYTKNGATTKITIILKEKLSTEQPLTLTLNMSLLTAVKWHRENVKKIISRI